MPCITSKKTRTPVQPINGHQFVETSLRQPTFCSFCDGFIFGIRKQGHQCQNCRMVVHKHCHQWITIKCSRNLQWFDHYSACGIIDNHQQRAHHFQTKTFITPTYCNHCGSLIYGCINQGVQCDICQMHIHHRCRENVGNYCGIFRI